MLKIIYKIKMSKVYFVEPILVLFLLLPIFAVILSITSVDSEIIYEIMKKCCIIIIPITATIWIIHVLGDYTEFEGNELLYVFQKFHFIEVIIVSLIFHFLLNISVHIIEIWIPDFSNEYINLLLISFMFQGACYFFSFFFHKAKCSILILILYVVIASIGSLEGSKNFNLLFFETRNLKEQVSVMLLQIIIAIIFWILGIIWDLLYPKYN